MKRTAEAVKKESENNILQVLTVETKPVSWTELKSRTGLSPRTLSKRLDDLEKRHIVKRTVDVSTYPPPVLYQLTDKGKELPESKINAFQFAYTLSLLKDLMNKEIMNKSEEKFVKIFSAKIGTLFMYTLMKEIETQKEWGSVIFSERMKDLLTNFIRAYLEHRSGGDLEKNAAKFKQVIRSYHDALKKESPIEINMLNEIFAWPEKKLHELDKEVAVFTFALGIGLAAIGVYDEAKLKMLSAHDKK